MTSHEILGFMSPALSAHILEDMFSADKQTYRAVLTAVAAARKVRPLFLERQPRAERHPSMITALSRPSMEEAAGTLLRSWLLKKHLPLLTGFLDALGIPHQSGVVEDMPATMDDAKLTAAVETVLAGHPHEIVAAYLYTFNNMTEPRWENLDQLLHKDPRLQLGG